MSVSNLVVIIKCLSLTSWYYETSVSNFVVMVECLSLDHVMVSGGQPEVKLNNSRLLGLLSMHEGRKVSTFLGIPFAEPPTGQLRYLCISYLLSIILSTVSLFRLRTPNRTTTVSAHFTPSIYHSLDNRTTTVSAHSAPSICHAFHFLAVPNSVSPTEQLRYLYIL